MNIDMNDIEIFFKLSILLLGIQCSGNPKVKKTVPAIRAMDTAVNTKEAPCKTDYHLIDLATNFKPTDLDLNNSLKDNIDLDLFLSKISEKCLIRQKDIQLFISLILLKQYHYHLSNFHQGYDLLYMKKGNASKIIFCFQEITRVNKKLEMLNSGYIETYLLENIQIRNSEIISYLRKINKIGDSISRGAYF